MRKTGGIDINVAWTLTGSGHGLTDLAKSSIWGMRPSDLITISNRAERQQYDTLKVPQDVQKGNA